MRVLRRMLGFAPVLAFVAAASVVDIGWFAFAPGSSRDVLPRIELEGVQTYPPDGRLMLTTVSVPWATMATAVRGLLDPAITLVSEEEVLGGRTEQEYEQLTRSQMDESKIAAVALAARRLTDYPRDHGPGALVQNVVGGSPAEGKLFPGDLIVAAGDEPVEGVEELAGLIERTEGKRAMTLTIEAGDEERAVRIQPRFSREEQRALLGVVLVEGFPFEVSIDSGDIGGPSAGLMWTLGVFELLSEEDLLGGRVVAGTGAVTLDGRVIPIGGVEQKVRAADQAGADVFLVPRENAGAARSVGPRLRLIPVGSVGEAIRALRPVPS
jgi:PDZ domain-containing protein